nr:hypothetical protein GCM10020093_109940 [Planobispora longispora]
MAINGQGGSVRVRGGPGCAARQMALLLILCTALTAVKLLSVPPGQRPLFAGLLTLALVAAVAGWWPGWQRLHLWAPLALCLPVLAVLSAFIWAAGGIAAGAAPFFVPVFVWLGIHFSVAAALAVAPRRRWPT